MLNKSIVALALMLGVSTSNAVEYALVEKDTYGTGIYYDGVIVNNSVLINSGYKKIDHFDISNPTSLQRKNDASDVCNESLSSLTQSGNIVAFVCDRSIQFIDVSNPNNITPAGSYDSSSYTLNSLHLEGNRLYVLGGDSELVAFDASDLSNIIEMGRTNVGAVNEGEMKIVGNYLYALNQFNTIDIYDISDPENLSRAASYSEDGSSFFSFEVKGNYLYIGATSGLLVVDISAPSSPSLVTTIYQDAGSYSISTLRAMKININHFIAVSSDKKVYSIDVSAPASPKVSVSKFTLDQNVQDIELKENSLVVMNRVDGIKTIDISDLNAFTQQDHFTQSMFPQNISLDTNSALIADQEGIYHVMELDSALNIIERGRISGYYNNSDGLLEGNTVRVSKNNEIFTLDITDLTTPAVLDINTISADYDSLWSYEKFGDQLHTGSSRAKLNIYTLSPNSLEEVLSVDLGVDTSTNTYRSVIDIAKKGSYLYLTTEMTDLSVIDITDSTEPVVKHYSWSSYDGLDRHIEVFGNRAFIARSIGLLVVDITDPTNPQFIEANSDFGNPDNIQAIDDQYAVIASDNIIYLVDFSDEVNPVTVDQADLGMRVTDVAADLSKILVSEMFGPRLKSYQINQAPISIDSNATVNEDNTLNESILVTDRENDQFTIIVSQDVANGALTIENDGSFSYTPIGNYYGSDSFIYEATDFYGSTTSSQVDITVTAVNDAPTASNFDVSVVEGEAISGKLLGTDVDGDQLAYVIEVNATNGNVTTREDGNYTYTPNSDYTGEDSFTYSVSEFSGGTASATVTINVTPKTSSSGGGSLFMFIGLLSLINLRRFLK